MRTKDFDTRNIPTPLPADGPLESEVRHEAKPALFLNWPPNSNSLTYTNFSVLYELTDRPNQVSKVPIPFLESESAHEVEKRTYRHLGEHPNLVKVIEMDQHGIWLERTFMAARCYMDGGEATPQERLQWCKDVARVFDFVYGKNVRHAIISGRNLLVDAEKRILPCNFPARL